MSNKHYFIRYWNDFSNTYDLCWTDNPEDEAQAISDGYKRITRCRAIKNCVSERRARRHNPSFSGYAPEYIMPYVHGKIAQRVETIRGYVVEKHQCVFEEVDYAES